MREKRGVSTGVGVGGSSILVIFILLCLTTFATLSMVSANADLRLTERTIVTTQEYYAADAAAEQILARVDAAVAEQRGPGITPEDYIDQCALVLAQTVPEAEVERDSTGLAVRYIVPVNDYQELWVKLGVPASVSGERCSREEWKIVITGEWEPEGGGMNLWDGGEEGMQLGGLPIDIEE